MNFRQIECFRAVMHTGSMTLAAAQLHTSQPNVSRAIALLQRETQLQLFERVGQRVVPTPEAHALLKEVDRIYVGLQSIGHAADRIRTLGVEGLRIAVTPGLGVSPVPRILQVFRGLRPRVPVVVHTADSATICKWVSSGLLRARPGRLCRAATGGRQRTRAFGTRRVHRAAGAPPGAQAQGRSFGPGGRVVHLAARLRTWCAWPSTASSIPRCAGWRSRLRWPRRPARWWRGAWASAS